MLHELWGRMVSRVKKLFIKRIDLLIYVRHAKKEERRKARLAQYCSSLD